MGTKPEPPGTFRGRTSRYSRAIVAREGQGLAHQGGTPRCPRRPWLWHPGGRGLPPQRQLHLGVRREPAGRGVDRGMVRLLAAGYYDEYRRAFAAAEE